MTSASVSDDHIIVIDTTAALMPAVFALRHEVFVIEQAVAPELERDESDVSAIHLVALRGQTVIGTLRIVRSGEGARIGRMAVRAEARKAGVGTRLMSSGESVARQMGVTEIVLHAQLAAKKFYRRLGYREHGDIFEEAGIPHVEMRKTIA
jgi:predicted GNAT family N-acyltransferase